MDRGDLISPVLEDDHTTTVTGNVAEVVSRLRQLGLPGRGGLDANLDRFYKRIER